MRELGYRPQLDALRAFAILGVLYSHLYAIGSVFAHLGVRLFFVISGFLITGILLRSKEALDRGRTSLRGALKTFFVRRGLRIYPAYYLLLLIVAILNVQQIRSVLGYHLLFLSNVLFIRRGGYVPAFAAPLWSLSVEEQFYLLWPFVILLTPRRHLIPAVVGAITVGLIYRLASWRMGATEFMQWFATPAALDALGAGALFALAGERKSFAHRVKSSSLAGLVLALPLYGLTNWWPMLHRTAFSQLQDMLVLLPMVGLVAAVTEGIGGWVGAILRWPPLVFIGRISFGIYLFHSSVWVALINYGVRLRPSLSDRSLSMLAVGSTLSIALATVSWLALERPLNELKIWFPYPSANDCRSGQVPVERPLE
jgi:peptidoglycan/LPS O-acetylase OafA/YrhL